MEGGVATTITSVRESRMYLFVCLGVTLYSVIYATNCALEGGDKVCGYRSGFIVVGPFFLVFFCGSVGMWCDVV